jgi:hypothetical protein
MKNKCIDLEVKYCYYRRMIEGIACCGQIHIPAGKVIPPEETHIGIWKTVCIEEHIKPKESN